MAELVRNGTLSAEMAALLWAAVDEQLSFLTVAVPQMAGKTTTANAALALRGLGVPLHHVAGEAPVMERLKRERLGGYLVVGEFSRAPMPGYIWGEPVRRVFEALSAGYALQTSLHASGAEEAMRAITLGNGVGDAEASAIKLVVYIERFGGRGGLWRRVTDLYEVHEVSGGRALGRSLFRWDATSDRFERASAPVQFASDEAGLARRAALIEGLARSGNTSSEAVSQAVAAFHAGA
jgi:hypothetical protein